MTQPVPEPNPCVESETATILLTLPKCEQYFHILIGHLAELTYEDTFDYDDEIQTVLDVFQAMIDDAVFGE